MTNTLLIVFGKAISFVSKTFNLGSGSTWPGHIALTFNKNFIKDTLRTSNVKIIFVAGTNGKTTTSKLIETIVKQAGNKAFVNYSGANLLNGIASSILLHSTILGTLHYDYAIFEIDENTLPLAVKEATPHYLILLNLFRDQLDRYGEVNTIANKWNTAMQHLPSSTTLILNADDPQIAYLGMNNKALVKYFGIEDSKMKTKNVQHAADATYCPNCSTKLVFNTVYFSHLGDWECPECEFKKPKLDITSVTHFPLPGLYNQYNTLAAVLLTKTLGIQDATIVSALKNFTPAFGRQEVIEIHGKKAKLFLSKNPTSFNESLRTIQELDAKHILLVLNDRIPDGRDVSWIWDVDFEEIAQPRRIISVSGDRVYDIALRLKYANISKTRNYADLRLAIEHNLQQIKESETLFIFPTYSAMLEVRKILTGKKIL